MSASLCRYLGWNKMELKNYTLDSSFRLMKFSDLTWLNLVLFVLFLVMYLVALVANILLILLQRLDSHLHTPMYFFISHLSFIDIFFTTSIVPKILLILKAGNTSISFVGCAMQMFFSLTLGVIECILLAVMAYDRHVAICQPLFYHVRMNKRICVALVASCWVPSLMNAFVNTMFIFRLPFCTPRNIKHFFCEMQPMFRLSCADTHINETLMLATSVVFGLFSFLIVLFSYIHIISTIMKINSSNGKSKVFSTCSSHLTVVIIYYGTIAINYTRPLSSHTSDMERVISLLYTVVVPMCNPCIYSMRNKEVKEAMFKAIVKISSTLKNSSIISQ
ncbi:olfactory receptor-like protein OLF3 [Pleurodeles waltl]|uniref:olfactory receptor-like protein OLF3 n=1 Tax=Pleurodeles waltl TaxID=8319 RepID=UPI00370994DB